MKNKGLAKESEISNEPSTNSTLTGELDGFALLSLCNVQLPSQAEDCVARSLHLRSIVAEDAPYFVNLSRLDVADNQLQLLDTAQFPNLQELEISCNNIRTLGQLHGGHFQHLTKLDLSYNCLLPEEIGILGCIENLVDLDLSHNRLAHLPAQISLLQKVSTLNLSHNRLNDDEVISSLSDMKSLKTVNLSHNHLGLDSAECGSYFDNGFSELQIINLAHNSIELFAALARLVIKPKLHVLNLTGNTCAMNTVLLEKLRVKGLGVLKPKFDIVTKEEKEGGIVKKPLNKKKLHSLYQNVDLISLGSEVMPTREQWKSIGLFGSVQEQKPKGFRVQSEKLNMKLGSTSTRPTSGASTSKQNLGRTSSFRRPTSGSPKKTHPGTSPVSPVENDSTSAVSRTKRGTTAIFLTQPGLIDERNAVDEMQLEVEKKLLQIAEVGEGIKPGTGAKPPRDPDRLQKAIAELRYALNNPLTSADEEVTELTVPHFRQLKSINKARLVPKRPYVSPREKKGPRHTRVGPSSRPHNQLSDIQAMLDSIDSSMDASTSREDTSNSEEDPLHSLVSMVNGIIDNFQKEETHLKSQRLSLLSRKSKGNSIGEAGH